MLSTLSMDGMQTLDQDSHDDRNNHKKKQKKNRATRGVSVARFIDRRLLRDVVVNVVRVVSVTVVVRVVLVGDGSHVPTV